MNPRYSHNAGIMELNPRLSRSQRSWLNLAVKTAEASSCNHKHGAVIVRGGSLLSIGLNKWRNDCTVIDQLYREGRSGDVSVHAEIDALSRVKDPAGATIYVARVNRNGAERLSKPCIDCATALKEAGITKVVYTLDEGIVTR